MADPADPTEIINPRRALLRRELAAGSQTAAQTPAPVPAVQMSQAQFSGRPATPEERAAQMAKLAALLRARQ